MPSLGLIGFLVGLSCSSSGSFRGSFGGSMWVVVKTMVPFWVPKKYGTDYLGYPKRDHNFDNHPCAFRVGVLRFPVRVLQGL